VGLPAIERKWRTHRTPVGHRPKIIPVKPKAGVRKSSASSANSDLDGIRQAALLTWNMMLGRWRSFCNPAIAVMLVCADPDKGNGAPVTADSRFDGTFRRCFDDAAAAALFRLGDARIRDDASPRGTDGSNPSPSSGESAANLTADYLVANVLSTRNHDLAAQGERDRSCPAPEGIGGGCLIRSGSTSS